MTLLSYCKENGDTILLCVFVRQEEEGTGYSLGKLDGRRMLIVLMLF